MDEATLIAGMRRELAKNILVAPIVLLVRLPLGLVCATTNALAEAMERVVGYIPGWRFDYWKALCQHRKRQSAHEATLLPERTEKP